MSGLPKLRLFTFLLCVLVLLALGATTSTAAAAYEVDVSLSNTRATPVALNGQTYAVGTNIYVFTSPDTPDLTKVEFYLDGTLRRTEAKAPYDFAGSDDTAGTANAYSVPSGSHTIQAKLYAGTTLVGDVSGSFCGGSCVAPTYELRVSASSSRTPSEVLNGQSYAVGAPIYVFTSPDAAEISTVAFSIDGAPYRTDRNAPYNLAGEAGGAAKPYTVPSGAHTISAKINLRSGGSSTVTGQFTGTDSTPPPPLPPPSLCTPTTTQTLGSFNVREIVHNTYHVQANEWGSSAPFGITNDGCPDLAISQSLISNSTSGAPGAYPSIYKGCHWGYCTSNSGLPLQAGTVALGGRIATSADTTLIATGAWDSAYDIWWNLASSTTNNSANGLEMMVWLAELGPIQPAGARVARGVSIGGLTYDVWKGGGSPGGTVSYVMTTPQTAVANLDLGPLAADAIARGYMTGAWWLLDVEYGFEPWQGGQGLQVNSFSVCTLGGC